MTVLCLVGHPPVEIPPDGTLLEAATAAGLPLPHGCRSGLCGACRVRLVAGRVIHDRHAAAALSSGERAAGLILACRAQAATDVTIAIPVDEPEPPAPRRLVARVAARRSLGPRITELTLVPPSGGLAFLPGQYATLGFAGLPPRDFSFAGLPGDETLAFHLRDAGRGTVARAAATLQPGDEVVVEGPFGRAYLRRSACGPLLLVAGGTGLAPMLSIARAGLAWDRERQIVLCAGAVTEDDLYGEAELARLAAARPTLSFRMALSAPARPTRLRIANVVEVAVEEATHMEAPVVHAAGPPEMIAALHRRLAECGVEPAQFHADAFTPVRSRPA